MTLTLWPLSPAPLAQPLDKTLTVAQHTQLVLTLLHGLCSHSLPHCALASQLLLMVSEDYSIKQEQVGARARRPQPLCSGHAQRASCRHWRTCQGSSGGWGARRPRVQGCPCACACASLPPLFMETSRAKGGSGSQGCSWRLAAASPASSCLKQHGPN